MRFISVIVVFTFLFTEVFSQNCTSERYLSNIFQSSVSQDVIYGNSPALTAVYVAESVTVNQEMTMDVFFPVGDDLPKRPAVILAYGGGYLVGTKEDEDVWATCDSLAKKGYVTASINYRMNMNIADPSSAVRAIYRAAQDYHAAIRYIKEYSNTYGIDTNYIFVGGVSAGGFSAMHAVYLDENERPAATYQSGLGGINPDLGCLSCSGNNFNHSNEVRGIINLWGALLDTSYIQQNELVPMTLFHGTDDLIVPYDYGFPFTALFLMPEVYGSFNVAARVNNLGGNAELNTFQGVGHNIWGVNVNNQLVGGPTEYWTPITDSIISFLYENIRADAPVLDYEVSACVGDTVELSIMNMPQDGRACWTVNEGDLVWANADSSTVRIVWLQAGDYEPEVVVFNHLEAVSASAVAPITVHPLPMVELTNVGGVLQASGAYPMYQWYLDGVQIPNEFTDQYTPQANGTYSVLAIEASTGCTAYSNELLVVGIQDLVLSTLKVDQIRAYDLQGRIVAIFRSETELRNHDWNQTGLVLLRYFNSRSELLKQEKRTVSPSF
ncbi:MAG: alpha/beta hydrolase [Flavobacteriales bacterium]|nr:alpha/beta hydrolase [Flavobacteriales bacterium]